MTTRSEDETARVRGWLSGRLPGDWFAAAPTVTIDREEITVVGRIPPPRLADDVAAAERAAAESGRIREFRERTRDQRIRIARELEYATGRKVAWGAACGETEELFTTLSVPVMTRLRQTERRVLDILVDSSVARSRSDALAWCVRLVGRHEQSWLADLRAAMERVEQVRADGPDRPGPPDAAGGGSDADDDAGPDADDGGAATG